MPRISGASLLSLEAYVQQRGPGAWEQVLQAMPRIHGDELRGIILPVGWYPTEAFMAAIDTAAQLWGDDLYEKYGTFAAEYEINLFQKMVLRFASPVFLMTRATRMWHRFHDTGEWDVEHDDHHVRGVLRNFAVVNGNYCRVLQAWLHRAFELTGFAGKSAHPQCRARGAEVCVFTGEWD